MKLTDTQLQQVIDSFAWSNHNKGITGDILRQFIQHLKDSVPLAKLADGKTIQEAITLLQAGVGTEGEGTGAAYESQLLLANAYADMGIEAGQLQSDFNAAVNAFIAIAKASPVYTQQEKDKLASLAENFRGVHVSLAALQTAIPTGEAGNYAYIDTGAESVIQQAIWDPSDGAWRMGASPVTGIDDVTGLRNELDDIRAAIPSSDVQDVTAIPSYDETSNYPAGDTYVSYVNQFALETPFNQLGIYKAEKNALPGQTPETDPYDPETGGGIWWYVGNKLVRDANVTTRGFVLSTSDLMNIVTPRHGDTCGLLTKTMSMEMCYRFESTATMGIKPADIDAASPGRWLLETIRPLSSKARAAALVLTDSTITIYPGESVYFRSLQGRTSIGVVLYNYPPIFDNNFSAQYSIIFDNTENSQDMTISLAATGTVKWGASGSIDSVAAGKVLRIDVTAQKVGDGVVYYVGHDKGGGTITTDAVPTAGSTNAVQSGGVYKVIEQMFKVNSISDVGEISCDVPFRINTITPQTGLTVTCKTSSGAIYTLGATVAAFDFITFQGNVTGKTFFVKGERV